MVTADEIFGQPRARVHADPGRGAAGQRPGRAVPRRRRPGHGRRHRLGHPPVLRRLRPGPAHRRRPGPQLPVRPRGVRPARRAARRRHRRGDRRALGGRDARQARRPRHRRPDVPAARPADVGHRRLDRSLGASSGGCGTTSLRKPRAPRKSPSDVAVLVARQPGLAALGGVQLRVVPEQRPDGVGLAAPGASRSAGRSRRCVFDSVRSSVRPGNARCRTATGEAVRHRRELGRGRPSSRGDSVPRAGIVKYCRTVRRPSAVGGRRRAPGGRLGASAEREAVGPACSTALAITTATYGSSSAAATRTQRSQPRPTDRADEADGADAIEMT